jgi:predicted patatin/cPLA2 family phospholipase
MRLEGQSEALRRLFENEQALSAGKKPPHRILLIGTGGGMACIRVPAYLSAWREAGLANAVDHAVTVSGSGGGIGAFLSGLPHRAVRIFETLAVSGFISSGSLGSQAMHLKKLGEALRGAHCPIAFDDRKIRAHRTSWHVVATRLTGESVLINAKEAVPDAAQAVMASSAFPSLTSPVALGFGSAQEEFVDGACGMPMPISAGIKKFRPDTVIVLESRPHPKFAPWFERHLWPLFAPIFLRGMPERLKRGVTAMDLMFAHESERLSRLQRIKWCRITPSPSAVAIGPLTTDGKLLRAAAEEAKRFMAVALKEAMPAAVV